MSPGSDKSWLNIILKLYIPNDHTVYNLKFAPIWQDLPKRGREIFTSWVAQEIDLYKLDVLLPKSI